MDSAAFIETTLRRRFLVEVSGSDMNHLDKVVCPTGAGTVEYIIAPELKNRLEFQFGTFFTKAVLSDDVFRYPRSQRIGVLSESPIDARYRHIPELIRRFPVIFTHQKHLLATGAPFVPLMFGTNWVSVADEAATVQALAEHPIKSQLVSFVGSIAHPVEGAYRLRREIAQYALGRGDVHCFGKCIREIPEKRDAIASYRFSIAMENTTSDHYFSEKLVDCLLLETIPIYFGCPSIGDLFDTRGMLLFNSRQQLESILNRLTPQLYDEMRVYAVANKERVIAQRWHNDAGLFSRLSEQIPGNMLLSRPRRYRQPSRLTNLARRLARRILSLR
jgi:hypothetical protein